MPESAERIVRLESAMSDWRDDRKEIREKIAEIFELFREHNKCDQVNQAETIRILHEIKEAVTDLEPRIDGVEVQLKLDKMRMHTVIGVFTIVGSALVGLAAFGENVIKFVKGG